MGEPSDWARLWEHRERLLRMARGRLPTEADAEDVVSEALLRAWEFGPERIDHVGSWLTCVVLRLCADTYRRKGHEHRTLCATFFVPTMPSPEDEICGRAAAKEIASLVGRLPEHQRHALALRADGADITSIASRLGLTYKAVESSLSRARSAVRAAVVRSPG